MKVTSFYLFIKYMNHIPYPKIHALHKEECDGILKWEWIIIQEKLDGANLSIWKEDGITYVGSRTQIVGDAERKTWFRGAVEYCNSHNGIQELLRVFPSYRLFWEWLVKHTVNYPIEYVNKFYLFDILENWEWVHPNIVVECAKEYWIEYPQIFATLTNPSLEDIRQYAGKSFLGGITGEWVVVKNFGFTNKFQNYTYGKYVVEEFKEKNSFVFWNSTPDDYEMKFVVEFVSIPRLMKLINKIEQNTWERIGKKHTPMIFGLMWNDIFTEELWWFHKKHKLRAFDFPRCEILCQQRAKILFFDFLDNAINTHNV